MATVNEALVIEASIKDSLTAQVADLSQSVEKFGEIAKQQFEATNKILNKLTTTTQQTTVKTEKMGVVAETVARKFTALGKAAVSIFAADVLAKVVGFGGAMDVLRKMSDAVSESIRNAIPGLAEWQDKIKLGEERVLKLRDALKKLRDEQNADEQTVGVGDYKFNFSTSGLGQSRAPGSPLDRALTIANQAQTELERLNRKRVGIEDSKGLGTPAYQEVLNDMQQTISRAQMQIRALEMLAAASDAGAAALKRYHEEIKRGNNIKARPAANIYPPLSAMGGAYGLAYAGSATRSFYARARENQLDSTFGGMGDRFGRGAFAFGMEAFSQYRAVKSQNQYPYSLEKAQDGRFGGGAQRSATPFGVLALEIGAAVVAKKKFDESFKGGALSEFRWITENLEQALGAELVGGGFQSLRTFFGDVISGAKKGADALRDFGRSIVGLGADILAQRFAANILGFVLPGTSAANGAVFSGGIRSFASGGMAYGPQLAMIGDNPNRQEAVLPVERGADGVMGVRAMGGGGGHHITFNINAIDGASVAGIMPQIEARLLRAINTGQNWALRTAVGAR